MKKLTERELKQQEELNAVFPLLRDLGIAEGQYNCGDKPDITVLYKGKVVGIEVVKYSTGVNDEAQNALQKVLDEYAREIDKKNEKRYVISVDFLYAEIPSGVRFKRIKSQLFNEIDNCLYDKEAAKSNQYISDVFLMDFPNGEKSFVSFTDTFEYEDTDLDLLQSIISFKERKLEEEYKKLSKNKDVSEWWLYVYFPLKEYTDYRNNVLPDGFSSTYDRIYLSEPCRYKEVFRKER